MPRKDFRRYNNNNNNNNSNNNNNNNDDDDDDDDNDNNNNNNNNNSNNNSGFQWGPELLTGLISKLGVVIKNAAKIRHFADFPFVGKSRKRAKQLV